MENPDLITPREANNYALIVAGEASRVRTHLGGLEATYAGIKAQFMKGGENGIAAKCFADATEEGKQIIRLSQHLKGLDEVIKVLKKALTHYENEARSGY